MKGENNYSLNLPQGTIMVDVKFVSCLNYSLLHKYLTRNGIPCTA